MKPVAIGRLVNSPTVEELQQEITRLRAEVARLRMTDEDHDALVWSLDVTIHHLDDPIAPIQRDRLRDLARRHGRDT